MDLSNKILFHYRSDKEDILVTLQYFDSFPEADFALKNILKREHYTMLSKGGFLEISPGTFSIINYSSRKIPINKIKKILAFLTEVPEEQIERII